MARQFEPQALVERAEKALESCEPHLAVKFLERALEALQAGSSSHKSQQNASDQARLLQLLGWAHMESVNSINPGAEAAAHAEAAMQAARAAYLRAVQLAPENNHEVYLHLGQLSVGKEAISFYEKGVQILMNEINSSIEDQSEQAASFRKKIGSALCSMTEIYMTDCCEEPEAESKCEEYMKIALAQNPENPEVHQTLASVRLSQSRPDDARASLEHSMDLWYTDPEEQAAAAGEDRMAVDMSTAPDPRWPPHPVRVALVKLLIETSLQERALAVLQTCQVDDEEDPETWYLYGLCYFQLSQMQDAQEMDDGTRSALAQDALECFQTVMKIDEKMPGFVEPEMMQQISELMQQLKS